jgi:hypothetical protein
MVNQVAVLPPPGAYWTGISIPVLEEDDSGIFCQKIEGLEPVDAEINTNSYNLLDGEFYVGSRVPKRNIVLHLVLDSRKAPTQRLRKQLYGYFTPKMNVLLQIGYVDENNVQQTVQIEGYVESFGGDRFSNDPEVDISIICPKPNFVEDIQRTAFGHSQVGTDPPTVDALNAGDRMVGFEMNIQNLEDIPFQGTIKVQRLIAGSTPGEWFSTQTLEFTDVQLQQHSYGHYLKIDTRKGKKVAEVRNEYDHDTKLYTVMGNMTDESTWPELWAAMNALRVVTTDTTGWAGHELTWYAHWYYEYGGI